MVTRHNNNNNNNDYYNNNDAFDYDSDSTCPTTNSKTSRSSKRHAKQQQQEQQYSPQPPRRMGYWYITLHTVLLLSLGLVVSNGKISFDNYSPQHLMMTPSVDASNSHRLPLWSFGLPTSATATTLLALESNNNHNITTFTKEYGHYSIPQPPQPQPSQSLQHSQQFNRSNIRFNIKSLLFGLDLVDRSKPLEFVHITKTGGSAIEMGAAMVGIQWGVCHYRKVLRLGCNRTANWEWPSPERRNVPYHMINRTRIEPWHTPPHWLVPHPQPPGIVANFVVVRNPYQRVLSEYYCPSFGYQSAFLQPGWNRNNNNKNTSNYIPDTPQTLNNWIVQKLQRNDNTLFHGHLMPQHYYVFDHVTGARQMDHILQYERLEVEFHHLMALYGLQKIRLPLRNASKSAMLVVDRSSRLTVAALTMDTIRIINEYYRLDFELFGYKMIPTTATTKPKSSRDSNA